MSLAVSQPVNAQDLSKSDSSSVLLTDSVAQDSLVTTMVDDETLAVANGEEEVARQTTANALEVFKKI